MEERRIANTKEDMNNLILSAVANDDLPVLAEQLNTHKRTLAVINDMIGS